MCEHGQKADALDAGGYIFDWRCRTYVNKTRKMLFTCQLVSALSAEALEARILSARPTGEWQYFGVNQPTPKQRAKLEASYR
jgi:hypothetical protein